MGVIVNVVNSVGNITGIGINNSIGFKMNQLDVQEVPPNIFTNINSYFQTSPIVSQLCQLTNDIAQGEDTNNPTYLNKPAVLALLYLISSSYGTNTYLKHTIL